MSDETIVAVFDTVEHAEAAVRDLISAGIPSGSISKQSDTGSTAMSGSTTSEPRERGFWASLFGGEPDHDTTVYDRSMQTGSTVVTVKVAEAHATKVVDILDRHSPIDLDERASSYGVTGTTAATETAAYAGTAAVGNEQTMRLSEERLAVGKRLVNLGGTRIRRFVVETPVTEQVSLHEERVFVERRPVTDGRAVAGGEFTDKTIEMTQSAEEAVVAKNTFVTEEIALRKEATDRVETIRDTVRREDVEVETIPGGVSSSTTTTKPYDKKI